MIGLKNVTLLLLAASGSSFVPSHLKIHRQSSSLDVSVVSEFLCQQTSQTISASEKDDADLLAAFEANTPESTGIKAPAADGQQVRPHRPNRRHRKHNFAKQDSFLHEEPDLDFYTLHSSVVSHLYKDMPINDMTRAIKRAQNLHDAHDLRTIGAFMMKECDEHWGYGFRGTLLSRLAVAALHTDEVELALEAIECRRTHERPSMQPFESAGIVRGLLRAGRLEDAWDVLEDELHLPMEGLELSSAECQERLKYRAHALSSIATRFFYQCEPKESESALEKLGELGSFVAESHIAFKDLKMPWVRLDKAATECNKNTGDEIDTDLRELVWNAMSEFPCPGNEEECSLDAFFMEP